MTFHRCQIAFALFTTFAAPGAPEPEVPAITLLQSLAFGGILVEPGGGRLTLTAEGSLVPEGPGLRPSSAPASAVARFRLRGPALRRFTLRLDPATPMLVHPRGGVLRLAAWLPSLPAMEGAFDASGEAEFKLGGTLDLKAGAAPGFYLATQARLQLNVAGLAKGVVSLPFTVSALLRAPLTLACTQGLEFGGLLPGTEAGRFEVPAVGPPRALGVAGPTRFRGTPHPAFFTLRGPARTPIFVLLPTELLLTGPRGTLLLSSFTTSVQSPVQMPEEDLTFQVGAAVTVGPQQPGGRYTGVFQVTVVYP